MGKKLKTQDRLKVWERNSTSITVCSLCSQQEDSHSHLFFECSYAANVWRGIRGLANLEDVPPESAEIVNVLRPQAHRNLGWNIVGKLTLGGEVYFVWHERNLRLFKKGARAYKQLVKIIVNLVRLRIMSMRFKDENVADGIHRRWDIETP